MANINARVDDMTKAKAEQIADSIGITLSTAISIFLNRFIAENGFPFAVTANIQKNVFEYKELENMVKLSVKENADTNTILRSSYMDFETKQIK